MANENFEDAITWLKIEQELYQGEKFEELDKDHPVDMNWWQDRIFMYLKRAQVLGLDNPLGRQAVAKAAATAVGMLENLLRTYGWVPQPGYPSGELRGDFPLTKDPHDQDNQ